MKPHNPSSPWRSTVILPTLGYGELCGNIIENPIKRTAPLSPTPSATERAVASERGKATALLCICVGKEVAKAGHY